ncbi:MAG TPA: glycosyltransferase family 2 protein [Candidatus Bathyarchaeia archaeon]|nr:glycosyltransferase family 2 protein [Candidatus Bathyarchaeia archaeon]
MSYFFLLLLGVLATLASLYTLYLGRDYERRTQKVLSRPKTRYSPTTCLIMTCKGDEPGLEKNIVAMLTQEYEDYCSVIVTDDTKDPAYGVAESVIARYPNIKAKLMTSKSHMHASGKVSALLTALENSEAEVYAFLDSDSFAPPNWLGELVDPLSDPSIGATTGYRWYFPSQNKFWSHVQSAWNAFGTSLLFEDKYNFPWGGAMAARADILHKIKIMDVWRTAVSDDLSLNAALREYGFRIFFLPQCMVASLSNITFPNFIKWATNQTALVRAYYRRLWNYALAVFAFFNITFALGLASALAGLLLTPNWFIPAFLLLLPSTIGVLRGKARIDLFKCVMPAMKSQFELTFRMDCIASLIVPWIMSYCILKSLRIKEIEWRGHTYKLATS